MTTIVFKDGILASDSIVTTESLQGYVKKLFNYHDKGCFALCGDLSASTSLLNWLIAGSSPNHKPELRNDRFCSVIHITTTGEVVEYHSSCDPIRIKSDFYAWGSGCDFAKGAMASGADATEAVQIACEFDIYSGGKIQRLEVYKLP